MLQSYVNDKLPPVFVERRIIFFGGTYHASLVTNTLVQQT